MANVIIFGVLDTAELAHFYLTHEYLADMLGVRRSGVSIAAGAMQQRTLISYSRGDITILDRPGLEGAAFVAGDLKKSLMHVRVTLDPSDEEFMPTEGNPLTKDQVQAFDQIGVVGKSGRERSDA